MRADSRPPSASPSEREEVSRKTYPPSRLLWSSWSCLGPPIQKASSPLLAVHLRPGVVEFSCK